MSMVDTPTGRHAIFTLDYMRVSILNVDWKILIAENVCLKLINITVISKVFMIYCSAGKWFVHRKDNYVRLYLLVPSKYNSCSCSFS